MKAKIWFVYNLLAEQYVIYPELSGSFPRCFQLIYMIRTKNTHFNFYRRRRFYALKWQNKELNKAVHFKYMTLIVVIIEKKKRWISRLKFRDLFLWTCSVRADNWRKWISRSWGTHPAYYRERLMARLLTVLWSWI